MADDGDWAQANGGAANTRVRLDELDAESVAGLAPLWEFPLNSPGPYGYAAGAPVVSEGVVFVQTLGGMLSALDLATGAPIWQRDVGVPTAGPVGPAVEGDRVFVSAGGAEIAAFDVATGEPLWSQTLEKDGFQPAVFDGTVVVGTGNQAHVAGNSGFVHALDAETGAIRWSFQVVEAGFWGNPGLNSGGGVWSPPAYDAARGLLYIGTGNAGPYPGTRNFPNGSSRLGPNLYTSALVALDIDTGQVAWYHQAVEHGLFDHDFQASPLLLDAEIDGKTRNIIVGSGKLGRVLAFDADTRQLLWDTPVGRHENDSLTEIPLGQAVLVYPGIFGGVETPLAAADDLVFVPVVNAGTLHTATGHGALDGSSALLNASGTTDIQGGTGELVALDVRTGFIEWRVELPSPAFGGATVLGDVVFTATYDGVIHGFQRQTGAEVWRYETGGGINAWPAVQDGVLLWSVGLGRPRLIAFGIPETPAEAGGALTLDTPGE